MGDVRKEMLPAADWVYNPFFDRAVQAVLHYRLLPACSGYPADAKLFCEAWPLIVFERSSELAQEASNVERHGEWLWCYKVDPQFSTDLLAAITQFIQIPREKWDMRRALIEFENQAPSDFTVDLFSSEDGPSPSGWDDPNDASTPKLSSWKEVATYIEMNCPHLKSVWLSAERLRKKEFYAEKKHRTSILTKWAPHFVAIERYGRRGWYERMPCRPA